MPVVIALVAGAAAAMTTGALVWRYPALDPAAPRVRETRIVEAAAARPQRRPFVRARLDPEAITGLLLTTALALALGAAVAIGALFVMAEHNALLARYDVSAARWGASHATKLSTRTLRDISILGGTLFMVAFSMVIAIVEALRTRTRAVVWFMGLVVIGETLLMNATKYIVDRPRPNIARLTGFSGSSFPSGHSATAAAIFAAAAFLIGRGRPHVVKTFAAAVAAGIAVVVASSRVFLGVHWLTDVLAGLALGWGWFAVCSVAFGGRMLRFGEPVEVAESAGVPSTSWSP